MALARTIYTMISMSAKSTLLLTVGILLSLQAEATLAPNCSSECIEEVTVEYYNDTLGGIMDGGGLRIEMASTVFLTNLDCLIFSLPSPRMFHIYFHLNDRPYSSTSISTLPPVLQAKGGFCIDPQKRFVYQPNGLKW
ncbi:unnamed protein product [Hydatigera taeniaeformis]|uniref:CUB domain-containing protein n=1 Tax=Hydatigena taeniaeformis TaxID=6205 RepID=A0A0R3X1M6_HYDTA|nr:unnamed protein product [Hydatigera taeniaeformis]